MVNFTIFFRNCTRDNTKKLIIVKFVFFASSKPQVSLFSIRATTQSHWHRKIYKIHTLDSEKRMRIKILFLMTLDLTLENSFFKWFPFNSHKLEIIFQVVTQKNNKIWELRHTIIKRNFIIMREDLKLEENCCAFSSFWHENFYSQNLI